MLLDATHLKKLTEYKIGLLKCPIPPRYTRLSF
jgi:hypothetical protein